MLSSNEYKREIVIVGVAVVVIALLARYAWLPKDPQLALQNAAAKWGLPVEGVGRWFSAWSLGDGQGFAVIASDPLGLDEGWQLDQPLYRYGRAGFAWLVWVFSLGQERWIPYGMALVGGLSVLGTFALAASLRPRLGPAAWLLTVNPAVFLAFAGDTAEALGILALGWAMATGSWWAAAALGVIRPTFAVALFGRWRLLMASVLTAGVLAALWSLRFGFELTQYRGRLVLPLQGYLEAPSPQAIALALFALLTLVVGWRKKSWAWVMSGLLVLCFSSHVIGLAENGWRVAGFLFVLWAFGPDYSPRVVRATSRFQSVMNRA